MKITIMLSFLISIAGFVSISGCDNNQGTLTLQQVNEPKSYLGYSSNTVMINGLRFHYVESGSGPVIILLHGFPYFGETWDPLLKPLSKRFHVVAPDNRGYGFTEKPPEINDYKIECLVSDVVELIKYVADDRPVIIIGHDWGGVLAWSVAQQHPALVDKLIVINAPPYNVMLNMLSNSDSQRAASGYISKMTSWVGKLYFYIKGPELMWGEALAKLHEQGVLSDEFKRAFLSAWSQAGAAEAAINWYKANIPNFDDINEKSYWPSKAARVTVPSLLIWSKDDKAFSNDTFREIPRFVDNLQIKVINTSSHTPFLDHTNQVIDYIGQFISTQ
ncbi:alpha/beta fold hydrolase [Shewanella sp. MF05960]|uniref:alpha/beta fold hydrolase n=1 Tax=Shewanella sp. MF05960 TaxID=3434874 RepID=UPI003D79082B